MLRLAARLARSASSTAGPTISCTPAVSRSCEVCVCMCVCVCVCACVLCVCRGGIKPGLVCEADAVVRLG